MGRSHSPEAQLLLLALHGERPAGSPELAAAARSVRDWPAIANLCRGHGTAAWLAEALAASDIAVPESTASELHQQAAGAALVQLLLAKALEEALQELQNAGISVVVLKGAHVAQRFYPQPALRPYTDADIMVLPSDQSRVASICAALGYRIDEDHGGAEAAHPDTAESQFETLYIHEQSNLRLDVHYDQLQIGLNPRDLDGFWQRCRAWRFLGVDTLVPSDNDLFIALAVHLHRHGFGRLIWLKDLDLMVRSAELDWVWLKETARSEGVEATLAHCLRLSQRLLATPLPPEAARWAGSSRGLAYGLLWRDSNIFSGEANRHRLRRAVQYVPEEGWRGILPSLALMGRRADKVRALQRRAGAWLGRRGGEASNQRGVSTAASGPSREEPGGEP